MSGHGDSTPEKPAHQISQVLDNERVRSYGVTDGDTESRWPGLAFFLATLRSYHFLSRNEDLLGLLGGQFRQSAFAGAAQQTGTESW